MPRPEPRATQGAVYTMAEAARLKGVSYHTVSRAIRRGTLPAQRLGRMALIAAEDLESWHPMAQKVPHKHRGRQPDPTVRPVLDGIATPELAKLADRVSLLETTLAALAGELARMQEDITELRATTDRDAG
jgi:excisionase family DNA binding protein